jgi:hypothetical protein
MLLGAFRPQTITDDPQFRRPLVEMFFDFFFASSQCRVPHISLVFREMWDTTNLALSAGFLQHEGYRSGTKTIEGIPGSLRFGKNTHANAG